MQEMIPMTELDYDMTKENADGNKDPIKRRQDSSNIATAAFVESMDVTNPNHRVSTASSSPQTTTGSPSSPKSSSVLGNEHCLNVQCIKKKELLFLFHNLQEY